MHFLHLFDFLGSSKELMFKVMKNPDTGASGRSSQPPEELSARRIFFSCCLLLHGFVCEAEAPLYRSIEDFDVKAFGDYATKLEALMDPAEMFVCLRLSLLQPQRGAEETVARDILKLNEARGDGAGFEPLAYRLFQIDAIAETHTEDPPLNFIHEAFETYPGLDYRRAFVLPHY